jgi:ribosomal protein S18 acetylase RimI-like enzyme
MNISSATATGQYRNELLVSDRDQIRNLVAATDFFSPAEVDIAVELVDAYLSSGPRSGYQFVLLDLDESVVGYACFGPIPCTEGSYDLYWIAVVPDLQQRGSGRKLLLEVERLVSGQRGRAIYVDTSSRDQYLPTRKFYESCGYTQAASLPDFYRPGDAKVIYVKRLQATSTTE